MLLLALKAVLRSADLKDFLFGFIFLSDSDTTKTFISIYWSHEKCTTEKNKQKCDFKSLFAVYSISLQ
jgi:hypothetical protein